MLSNAYFLAKFRFDTAENEPAKISQNFANFADPNPLTEVTDDPLGELIGAGTKGLLVRASPGWAAAPRGIGQTLHASFSTVSKANFARKYAFDSIFQALQDFSSC